MYIVVAEHGVMSDPRWQRFLPDSVSTRYVLTQVADGVLKADMGKAITKNMTRSEAERYKRTQNGKPSPTPRPLAVLERDREIYDLNFKNDIADHLFGGLQYRALSDPQKAAVAGVVAKLNGHGNGLVKDLAQEEKDKFWALEIQSPADSRHKMMKNKLSDETQKRYDSWHAEIFRARDRFISEAKAELQAEAERRANEDDEWEGRPPSSAHVIAKPDLVRLREPAPDDNVIVPDDGDHEIDGEEDPAKELRDQLRFKLGLLKIWINKEHDPIRLQALADRLANLQQEFNVA